MLLTDFLAKYYNELKTGNTPENKGECVGLISMWVEELGLPHIWGHAKDLLTNADKNHFKVIKNSIDNYPVAGDIVCWDKTWGGGFGHTGVVIVADKYELDVFEQNPNAPHIIHHPNYSGVQGWLRVQQPPQQVAQSPVSATITDQTMIPIGGKWGNMELQAVRSSLNDMDNKIATYTIPATPTPVITGSTSPQNPPISPEIPQVDNLSISDIIASFFKWVLMKFR